MTKPAVIHIGKVTVPIVDYAVGAAAVLGIRDSGKTVTSKGIAEQLLDNGIPIIVFDAVGKWRWMKVAGDRPGGKGYKIVVAGGRGPDLPLNPHSVPEIVRSALKERIPLIIDLFEKTLSKADWRRIVQTAIQIIHYENEGGAVHVFLEEAAEFVPQRVIDGEVYAEVEKLVRMGGNASVGITLINQRSQEVNKAVLDQCTSLILGCQVGSKAIEAVGKWVDRLDSDTANSVTESLPTLVAGEVWVWTRQNPDKPYREKIPMCRSFHPDRRTPEIVLQSAKPTDTAEFVAKMTNAIPKIIEDAKANDPSELKKRIRELEKQVRDRASAEAVEIKTVPVFTKEDYTVIKNAADLFDSARIALDSRVEEMRENYRALNGISAKLTMMENQKSSRPSRPVPARAILSVRSAKLNPRHEPSNNGTLGKCERAILATLAQHMDGCNINKLAILSGYTQSGSFKNCLSTLRTSGDIEGENLSVMRITANGLSHGPFPEIPSGDDRLEYWLNFKHFGKCERAILEVLIDNPDGLMMDDVCEKCGYELPPSGSFKNSISTLRTSGVLIGRNNELLKPSELLFE